MLFLKNKISPENAASSLHRHVLFLVNALKDDFRVYLSVDENMSEGIKTNCEWEHYFFISSTMYLMLMARLDKSEYADNLLTKYIDETKIFIDINKQFANLLLNKFQLRIIAYKKAWEYQANDSLYSLEYILFTTIIHITHCSEIQSEDDFLSDFVKNPSINESYRPIFLFTPFCLSVVTNIDEYLTKFFNKNILFVKKV